MKLPAYLQRDPRYWDLTPAARDAWAQLGWPTEIRPAAGYDLVGTVATRIRGFTDAPRVQLVPVLAQWTACGLFAPEGDGLVYSPPPRARRRRAAVALPSPGKLTDSQKRAARRERQRARERGQGELPGVDDAAKASTTPDRTPDTGADNTPGHPPDNTPDVRPLSAPDTADSTLSFSEKDDDDKKVSLPEDSPEKDLDSSSSSSTGNGAASAPASAPVRPLSGGLSAPPVRPLCPPPDAGADGPSKVSVPDTAAHSGSHSVRAPEHVLAGAPKADSPASEPPPPAERSTEDRAEEKPLTAANVRTMLAARSHKKIDTALNGHAWVFTEFVERMAAEGYGWLEWEAFADAVRLGVELKWRSPYALKLLVGAAGADGRYECHGLFLCLQRARAWAKARDERRNAKPAVKTSSAFTRKPSGPPLLAECIAAPGRAKDVVAKVLTDARALAAKQRGTDERGEEPST